MSVPSVVYKYEIDVGGSIIDMPHGAKILHVAAQGDRLFVWALVNAEHPDVEHMFFVAGTGHHLPAIAHKLAYIGTVHTPSGFVLHAFGGVNPS